MASWIIGGNVSDKLTFHSLKHKTVIDLPEMKSFITQKVTAPTETFADKEFFLCHQHALLELANANELRDPNYLQHVQDFFPLPKRHGCPFPPTLSL